MSQGEGAPRDGSCGTICPERVEESAASHLVFTRWMPKLEARVGSIAGGAGKRAVEPRLRPADADGLLSAQRGIGGPRQLGCVTLGASEALDALGSAGFGVSPAAEALVVMPRRRLSAAVNCLSFFWSGGT